MQTSTINLAKLTFAQVTLQEKNDIIADVAIRMQTDVEFAAAVESLYKLDKKKLSSILTLLD